MKSLFLGSRYQNITVLTPVVMSLTQNWVKKGPTCISCTNVDRKIKVDTKRKLEVKKNSEVLTRRDDVINPEMNQKYPSWYFVYQY